MQDRAQEDCACRFIYLRGRFMMYILPLSSARLRSASWDLRYAWSLRFSSSDVPGLEADASRGLDTGLPNRKIASGKSGPESDSSFPATAPDGFGAWAVLDIVSSRIAALAGWYPATTLLFSHRIATIRFF